MIDFLAWSGSGAVVGSFATILFNYVRNRKVDKQKEKSLADSKLEKKRIRQMEAVRSVLGVMSRDVVLAPARNDTVPIQEVSVQTACRFQSSYWYAPPFFVLQPFRPHIPTAWITLWSNTSPPPQRGGSLSRLFLTQLPALSSCCSCRGQWQSVAVSSVSSRALPVTCPQA